MNDVNKNAQFYFLTPSIGLKFGGLTTALFRRAHLFTENFADKINVLTFKYSPNLDAIKENLKNKGYTNDKIEVINLYDYLSYTDINKRVNAPLSFFHNTIHLNNNEYQSDEYELIKITQNEKDNVIRKIECFVEGNIAEILEFDIGQCLKRRRIFENGNLSSEIFYRNDQSIYMKKKFAGTEKSTVKEIELLDYDERVLKKFSNHQSLQSYWLSLILDEDKTNFFVTDGRALDKLVLEFKKKPIVKIFVIHSIHLREPYGTYSVLRLGNRDLLRDIGQADSIVLLTNGQKRDLEKRFGNRTSFNVIPHSIKPNLELKNKSKIENRFVVISRLHEEKQLDHIITAFQIVRDNGFDFKLDIFGDGNQQAKLQTLIDENGLENQIKLKEFTSNPLEEFSVSEGSILTSKYEGFGLSILESLSCSCPVFAYDLKYGPNDMIQDGTNGFLIEKSNIKELANSIINYLKLPRNEKEKMFDNAFQSVNKFSEQEFVLKWKKELNRAAQSVDKRFDIAKQDDIQCKLESIYFKNKSLNVKISVMSSNDEYKTLKEDIKEIKLEVNNHIIDVNRVLHPERKGILEFESIISLKQLKEMMNGKRNSKIYYYVNLDDITYKAHLKSGENLTQKDMQAMAGNVYQIERQKDHTVNLRKQKLDGFKGLLRYIKYL